MRFIHIRQLLKRRSIVILSTAACGWRWPLLLCCFVWFGPWLDVPRDCPPVRHVSPSSGTSDSSSHRRPHRRTGNSGRFMAISIRWWFSTDRSFSSVALTTYDSFWSSMGTCSPRGRECIHPKSSLKGKVQTTFIYYFIICIFFLIYILFITKKKKWKVFRALLIPWNFCMCISNISEQNMHVSKWFITVLAYTWIFLRS